MTARGIAALQDDQRNPVASTQGFPRGQPRSPSFQLHQEPSWSRRACRTTACGSYGWLLPTLFWCLFPFSFVHTGKPAADALHNASSAMTSLHWQVEHRRASYDHRSHHTATSRRWQSLKQHVREQHGFSNNRTSVHAMEHPDESSLTPRVSSGIRAVRASSLVSSRLRHWDPTSQVVLARASPQKHVQALMLLCSSVTDKGSSLNREVNLDRAPI